MFTGLIEQLAAVKSVSRAAGSMKLTIDLGPLAEQARTGDSIAVNGLCLTVAELSGSDAQFDVSPESLKKSALGQLRTSDKVNIETALRPDSRLGGHFVQGHIDGTAEVSNIRKAGDFWNITFSPQRHLVDTIIPKGSIAVDGISLTVAEMTDRTFSTAVIPETLKRTNLDLARIGKKVNIETDLIVKTIKRQLENILPANEKLTVEKLKEMGF